MSGQVISILVYQEAKVHSVRYRAENAQAALDGNVLGTVYVPNGVLRKLGADLPADVPARLKVTIEVEE